MRTTSLALRQTTQDLSEYAAEKEAIMNRPWTKDAYILLTLVAVPIASFAAAVAHALTHGK